MTDGELAGQTVVLIGGSAGIGLETARRALAEGANVVLTGRNEERLEKAAGFVDTPLSASLLGDDLDARRAELSQRLPIGRVVGPRDVAALAVHLMTNTALTGATYDIDGGQQFVF
ncbi:SDR family oxidoreductase [Amycolatopsis sp. FDAARGOS 1241]|uniref:SDR family NAD(P)-dependent oxidoreductase n=1 Tax=Amycolatopsis sp. FDAARGOS 1241 TaxID=2778070 RepID=UPI001950F766|nr:SDR family oxidoreductase [Amycolatopsis sp. FDAARGOS 1241]QRP49705.1 SDR family oxidoreductase [Amycolatopsis sp. FDAARGOS 1241]